MHVIRNKAACPRFFNLKTGAKNSIAQRTLAPGEAAELDLMVDPEQDSALQAMVKAGEIEVLSGAEAKKALAGGDADKELAELEKKAAEGEAARKRLAELRGAADADASRRTPPHQLGGDGGPEQMPTVDGSDGAPTKSQEEAGSGGAMDARKGAENAAKEAERIEKEENKAKHAAPARKG